MTDLKLLEQLESLIPRVSDDILQPLFRQTTAKTKADGSIVTEADMAMQDSLTHLLKTLDTDVVMLGEEMSADQQADIVNSGAAFWCLDPVDGTNNFHHGVPLFAVSLALIADAQVQLGVVYDPVRRELFSATTGSGLRLNGNAALKPEQPQQMNRCLASVDFKRLNSPMKQRLLEQMPFKSQRNIGTCALEWAWLAAGRTQLLLHGGEKLWDYAAGILLLQQGGGISCSADGEAIFNNTLQPRPVIAASEPELHRQWYQFLTG